MAANVVVENLLLAELQAYAKQNDLSSIALNVFDDLKAGYYFETPGNALTFACTGGDGVHFSLLKNGTRIDDASPVVVTLPGIGENYIVGENLLDFLCLGSSRGFLAIEHVSCDRELTLRAYTDPDWQPTTKDHFYVGLGVKEDKRRTLEALKARFNLVPWTDPRRFAELQSRFSGRLAPSQVDIELEAERLRRTRRS